MKQTEIEIDRTLETAFEPPIVDNAAQTVLRRALALLGPNGENWVRGTYRDGHKYCSVGAITEAIGCSLSVGEYWIKSNIPGYRTGRIASMNDRAPSFSEVREMFEQMIVAAGSAPAQARQPISHNIPRLTDCGPDSAQSKQWAKVFSPVFADDPFEITKSWFLNAPSLQYV